MKKLQKKQAGLRRRHTRVRGKISGTAARPRLCITRSNSNMYAQVIDDVAGKTICGVSTLGPEFKATEKSGATVDGAAALGLIIGKKAQENGCIRPRWQSVSRSHQGSCRWCPRSRPEVLREG